MTGFARVKKTSDSGEVVLTVKSVNHRGLDIHFHMSDELDVFENALRSVLKRHVFRGHFQVRVVFTRSEAAAPSLNRGLLEAYFGAFRQAASEMGISGEPDLNAALALPGMFRETEGEQPEEAVEQFLVSALEEAVLSLNAFREREGQELAAELSARAAAIRDAASRMQELRTQAAPAYQARLSERLAELLGGTSSLEPQRLVQEAALLADRSDISEEITRLRGPHVPVGRASRRRRRNRQETGFPPPGDGPRGKHDPLENQRSGGSGPGHDGSRAGRESRNRKNQGTGAELGMSIVFIISAPSGSGKSTLVNGLLKSDPGLVFSISYTTREPRAPSTQVRVITTLVGKNSRPGLLG